MQLQTYCRYNLWANTKILDVLSMHADENTFDRQIISSFPSLRKTICHIWGAETIWLARLRGEMNPPWPGNNFAGSQEELRPIMLKVSGEIVSHVAGLDEENLKKEFTYVNLQGMQFTNIIWEAVLHCMNHSTYHRGQIVTMLRQCGVNEIPSTDFINFCRAGKN